MSIKQTSLAMLCIFFLLGCTDEIEFVFEQYKPTIETEMVQTLPVIQASSLLYERATSHNRQHAQSALTRYFGQTMVLQSLANAPSGIIEIIAKEVRNGQQRKFYLMPDLKHLIAGVLYSPYLKPDDITAQHSKQMLSLAQRNQSQASATADFKQTLRDAIKNQQPSKATLAQATLTQATRNNLEQHAQAAQSHLKTVNDFSPILPQTAPLPTNYSGIDAEGIYASLEQSQYIRAGSHSDKVLYVFFDFRCPACLKSHADLLPRINNGDVQVRFVPVGILGKASEAKATYVLTKDNMDQRLALMKTLMGNQPIAQLLDEKPDRALLDKGWKRHLSNTKLLIATNKVMTPLMVYRTENSVVMRAIPPGKQMAAAIQNIRPNG